MAIVSDSNPMTTPRALFEAPGEECDLSAWEEFRLPAVTKTGFPATGFTKPAANVKLLSMTPAQRAAAVASMAPPVGRVSWAPREDLPHWSSTVGKEVTEFFQSHFSLSALQALVFIYKLDPNGTAKAMLARALVAAEVAPVPPVMIRTWPQAHLECRSGLRHDGPLTSEELSRVPLGVLGTPPPLPAAAVTGGQPAGGGVQAEVRGLGVVVPAPNTSTDLTAPTVTSLLQALQQQAAASNAMMRAMADQAQREKSAAEARLADSQAAEAALVALRSKPLLERVLDEAAAAFGAEPRAKFFDASRLGVPQRQRMASMRPLPDSLGFKQQAKSQATTEADLARGSKAASDIRQGFRYLFSQLAARPVFPATRLKDMLMWWSRLHELVLPGVQESQRMAFAVAFAERHAGLLGQPSVEEEVSSFLFALFLRLVLPPFFSSPSPRG